VQPDEYIENFFKDIESQLSEVTIGKDRRSAHYKDLEVAAKWSGDLWDIKLDKDNGEPIHRLYDPSNARSARAAADYFVDELRKILGEEPFPRVALRMNNFRARPPVKK
jgi:hypothetical protein